MNLENNFSYNLKTLRKSNNLTQKDLGEKIGLTKQAISYFEKGTRMPDLYTTIKIANFFNCSIDSLIFSESKIDKLKSVSSLKKVDTYTNQDIVTAINELDKVSHLTDYLKTLLTNITNKESRPIDNVEFSNELSINVENNIVNFNEYKQSNSIDIDFYKNNNVNLIDASTSKSSYLDNLFEIPFYGGISCGVLKYVDNHVADYLYIPKNELKYNHSDYFILQVDGDSMNKLYKNGDYLLIRKTNCFESHNKPYVFMLGDEATLKFIEVNEDNLRLIPHSDRSSYTTQNITFDELKYMQSTIVGTVEGVLNFANK